MSEDFPSLTNFNRILHSPARLTIVAILSTVEEADFTYLLNESGLTKGNLSTHLTKLEQSGYIEIEKTYRGKIPLTLCRLTQAGQTAFKKYRKQLKRFVDITSEL
jgi:DNA-binding MarR family transcriptional regulator